MSKLILPEVGTDWVEGCENQYIVISLKHSTVEITQFWKQSQHGYTVCPFFAGRFSKETIERNIQQFNDGLNAVAIPLTHHALNLIGLGSVIADYSIMERVFCSRRINDEKPTT